MSVVCTNKYELLKMDKPALLNLIKKIKDIVTRNIGIIYGKISIDDLILNHTIATTRPKIHFIRSLFRLLRGKRRPDIHIHIMFNNRRAIITCIPKKSGSGYYYVADDMQGIGYNG